MALVEAVAVGRVRLQNAYLLLPSCLVRGEWQRTFSEKTATVNAVQSKAGVTLSLRQRTLVFCENSGQQIIW